METDFYEILQVSPRAEVEVIEAAYRRLAIKYHPDHNKSSDAADKMKALNEAYRVLRDPTQRARYDMKRQSSWRTSSQSTPRPTARPQPTPQPTPRPTPRAYTPPPASPPPSSAPPKASSEKRKSPSQGDVFVSESLVDDSIEFLKKNEFVTIGLLERNLGIGAPRADRLFHVLIARGIIDREGKRIEQPIKEEATDGKPAAEAAPHDDLESLIPELLKLLRTEKAISVSLLEEQLLIGFARASALYQLAYEQQIVDRSGKPTAMTKARLATIDLGAVFECPFCERDAVHHYQTKRRLLPDTHYLKCPTCFTEFEKTEGNLYRLVQVPERYAPMREVYKNRSFNPAQWQVLKRAAKLPQ